MLWTGILEELSKRGVRCFCKKGSRKSPNAAINQLVRNNNEHAQNGQLKSIQLLKCLSS